MDMPNEATEPKEESPAKPRVRKFSVIAKRRQLIKPSELVMGTLFIVIVIVLSMTLINKLTLKNDITNAKAVSSQVIADIGKQNGAGIRSLGSPNFQKQFSAAYLTQGFKSVEVATYKTPTVVDQIVGDTPHGRIIFFVYKYSALKVPFYVRTEIEHESGHWYLVNISGNIDESQLTGGN
jgi:hypothetical protein